MKNLTTTKNDMIVSKDKSETYGLTKKEKEKNIIGWMNSDDALMDAISELAGIPTKTVTIDEFILKYGNCINDRKHFKDNFDDISYQHSFGESIDSIVKAYCNTNAIKNNQLSDLKTSLEKILKSYIDCQFKYMEASLLRIELEAKNVDDALNSKLRYVLNHFKVYKTDLIKIKKIRKNNEYDFLYELYNYLQPPIKKLVAECRIDDKLGKKSSYPILYKKFVKHYPKIKNEKPSEKKNNKNLAKQVIRMSDRVIELHNQGSSFINIQKTITKECIEKGTIPETIQRKSRKSGDSNKIVEVPCKLPLTAIKKVIKENNVQKVLTA